MLTKTAIKVCDTSLRSERPTSGRLNGQYDLANMLTGLHELVSFGSLFKRKGLVDHRLDFSCIHQRPYFFAQVCSDRGLECVRARSQGGSGHGEAADQDLTERNLRFAAAQQGDEHQTSVIREATDFTRYVIAADHVENHVHAFVVGRLLDDVAEILGFVVDADLGSQRFTCTTFLVTTGCGENTVSQRGSHLNRRHADARGAALDQQTFTL